MRVMCIKETAGMKPRRRGEVEVPPSFKVGDIVDADYVERWKGSSYYIFRRYNCGINTIYFVPMDVQETEETINELEPCTTNG